ncbi:Autophagy protein [Parelaphostrongylus tenuis]|uniref:Autophagy-related protein 2 n=1 Tax=Parelaphostrongylus tenuis TaxID=148309 RepID=A0AAD5MFR1_PARTN|nr:Autophagy protein [Parelaphostrongylus tenuis]
MEKIIEEEAFQKAQVTALKMQESKIRRKEYAVLLAKIGAILVRISYVNMMSVEFVRNQGSGYKESIEHVLAESNAIKLEYDPRNKAVKASDTKIHCVISIADEMTKSFLLSVIQSLPQRESPFAQNHRSFLHKREEGNDSPFVMSFDVSILRLLMPSHSYLEVLYDRMVNDLLIWRPAIASARPRHEQFKINAFSDALFQECSDEDDHEEELFHSFKYASSYDTNKSHLLSLLLNMKKGMLVVCPTVDKGPSSERNIKYIGSQHGHSPLKTGTTVYSSLRLPSDWRSDVVAPLSAKFSTPIVRYVFRDICISLHLYQRSDLSNLFDNKSRASHGISPVEDASTKSNSPDIVFTDPSLHELVSMAHDLHLVGDWSSDSEIKLPDNDHSAPIATVDKNLIDASLHESLHEDDIIFDDENSAEMPSLSAKREKSSEMAGSTRSTTFFKEFIFSPTVSIYVDYHGKNRINVERNGAVFAVLSGIGQLNRTKFVLKEIVNRNGLLGISRCLNVAVDEWMSDIKSSIPNVLASCGPISPIVQIGRGVVDLFWLPVAELRKEDGHVVKGIQKGVGSFGLSSAAGVVGMAQTVVGVVQMLAETVLHEVQPSAPYLNERNRRYIAARTAAPVDLRHGLQLAYDIASDGYRRARDDLELAAQEDRASGQSSFRNVLKVAPTTIIRPLVCWNSDRISTLGRPESPVKA